MPGLTDIGATPVGYFNTKAFLDSVSTVPTEVFPTGLEELDEWVKIVPGELVVIAARPRHGKSTAAYNIILNGLLRNNGRTFILYTHEVPVHLAVARMATIYAHRAAGKVLEMKADVIAHYRRNADGTHGFPFAINEAFDRFGIWGQNRRLIIINEPTWNADQIRSHAERVRKDGCEIGGVFIDYIEMLAPLDKSVSREQQIGQSVNALRIMTNELLVPTILLSQLNRDSKGMPTLEGLRYSGQLEQEASTVIGLFNLSVEMLADPDAKTTATRLDLLILKNRGGGQGIAHTEFNPVSGLMETNLDKVMEPFGSTHPAAAPIGGFNR